MVYGRYIDITYITNYIVNGVYKPTNITGGYHIEGDVFCLTTSMVLICFRIFGDFDVVVLVLFFHVLMDSMVNSMNIWWLLFFFRLGRGNLVGEG